MESQIKAYYPTPQGYKFVSIFGYASKSLPGLEINGVGRLSRNIKEKIIFLTRTRKLKIPAKRFVICVELNDLQEKDFPYFKWLEFPLLLTFWHLAGLIPISKLDDCLSSGMIKSNGEIFQISPPANLHQLYQVNYPKEDMENIKFIGGGFAESLPFWSIDSNLLLEHIPNLTCHAYIERSSVTPVNSCIT